jgi:hypothetical protein
MGTAHAGHDQCAHCYFQYVKPALQAERKEMKRRRALKRGKLASPPPITVRDAVTDVLIEQDIDRGLVSGKDPYDVAASLLQKTLLDNIPLILPKKDSPPMPVGRPPKRILSDEERLEIGRLYEAGLTYDKIKEQTGANAQTVVETVRRLGLPLRNPRSIDRPVQQHVKETPPMPSTSTPETPHPNGVIPPLQEWVVTYTVTRTETTIVAASGFTEAAAAVSNLDPDVDVVSVAKKLP